MKIKNIKSLMVCLVLLMLLIGAASAADDSSDSAIYEGDAASDSVSEYAVGPTASEDASFAKVSEDASFTGVSEDTGIAKVNEDTSLLTINESSTIFIQSDVSSKHDDVKQKDSSGKTILKDGESTTIFVSNSGSDENSGLSSQLAVATVSKAIEIVGGMGGADFTVFIANGNYNVSRIDSPQNKNISLVGESKEGAIIHFSDEIGITVLHSDLKWCIENLTFCDMNSSTSTSSAIRTQGACDFYMNNCIFRNIGSVNGLLYIGSAGQTYISNVLIEDCFGTNKDYHPSIINFFGSCKATLDNIEIRGSYMMPSTSFFAKPYLGYLIQAKDPNPVVTLMNSRIVDNRGSLGIIGFKGKLNVINTTISNNSFSGDLDWGGNSIIASDADWSTASHINVTQSLIEGNTLAKTGGGIFDIEYGNHNIDHSIILNNKYSNGDDVPFAKLASGTSITADDNYWGTNERPNNQTDKWVTLTADVPEYQFVGVSGSIPIYLNTYATADGETGNVEGMPSYDMGVSYALNQENPSSVTIADGSGTINYLAGSAGTETLTLSTGDSFSFEVSDDISTLIYVDSSVENTGTGTSESPFKTIAEALNIAADGKIIIVRSGTYREKDLVIDDAITLKADKNADVIIDGENGGRIFTVTSTATIRDLSLTGAMSTGIGGAIYVDGGNLTGYKLSITNSQANSGAAIASSAGSKLNISNSVFDNNSADYGGAIYIAGEADIFMNEFSNHADANYGGAIYLNTTSSVSISSNSFEGNLASKGEAIYVENAALSLSGNLIADNETIYLAGGSVNSNLVFLGGQTIAYAPGSTVNLTADLTDDKGNLIRGGTVTFTLNGETIGTPIDLSGSNEIASSYDIPEDAVNNIVVSGSYSLDNGGKIVNGTIHPAVPHWFIEGGRGFEFLNEAIGAANSGDVIYGTPGTYIVYGLTISKDITIKANKTGEIILDGDRSQMFVLSDSATLTLANLDLTNAGGDGGAFVTIYLSGGNLNLINSTVRDLRCSQYYEGGAIKVLASGSVVNIEGSHFRNITSTKEAAVLSNPDLSNVMELNIRDSSFSNITCSGQYTLMKVPGKLTIERSNFTDIRGNDTNYFPGAIGTTKPSSYLISECRFINVTGGDGSAIYFYNTGNLTVRKSVFMNNINRLGTIYLKGENSANINYNLFINNTCLASAARDIFIDGIPKTNASYNYWGDNSKPASSQIDFPQNASEWTIVDLSSSNNPVYLGTTAEISVKFMGTDGNTVYALEESMPEYSLNLQASEGTIDPASVTIVDNLASAIYTPPSMVGTVSITASPSNAELEIEVIDTSRLLVVSTDGSNTNSGTLESPYATIAYALTQATETRNIVYLLDTGNPYAESGLAIEGNIIIKGANANVIIDGKNNGRIFTVTGTVTIEDLCLSGGNASGIGGAIFVDGGNLTVDNLAIFNSSAASGGAIGTSPGSSLTVSNSLFNGNMAMYGGAIYVSGEAAISNCAFDGNKDVGYGGAIYINTSSPISISSNTFKNNSADLGEAIYIKNGDVNLSGNVIEDNETIYLAGGSVSTVLVFLNNSTVKSAIGESISLTADLTDDMGNIIRGGSVSFTANGESVGTVDLSGDNELACSYFVPEGADADILISGSYSFDNGGTVSTGNVHPMIPCWFIEGGNGYEDLADAVEAASDGDVIYGRPGTYVAKGIQITKDISIKANETGSIILDGENSRIFTIGANVDLINLTLMNGGSSGGGFVSVSGAITANIINSTLRDLRSTGAGGAISVASNGKLNIKGSQFENMSSTNYATVLYATGADSIITIEDSSFNDLNCTNDYTLMRISGNLTLLRSNFTNIFGRYTSNWYGAIGLTDNANASISECQFINMTGGDGSAIYFNSKGNLNVCKSVFMANNNMRGTIHLKDGSANINYNLFIDNKISFDGSAKDVYENANGLDVNADYNFWGSNSQPTSSEITTASNAGSWAIVDLSTLSDTLYMGKTAEIKVKFVGTDGNEIFALEDSMPECSFDLLASDGILSADSITVKDNIAVVSYTPPAAEGSVTITATPGPAELVLNVKNASGLLVVSTDGDNANPGTLDSPYATIAYALTQVTETRNVIYLLNKGEDYREHGLILSGNIAIKGGDEGVTINGEKADRIFIVTGNATISDLVLTGGNSEYGGAIYINTSSEAIISSVEFKDNNASKGEAIYIENGAVILSGNKMPANETIYLAGGSVNSNLVFLNNATVKVEFGESMVLTATLTDDNGNAIRGGSIVFTADGETVGTVDLSGDSPIEVNYIAPDEPSEDVLISGSYSFDNGGTVSTAIVHPCIFNWLIESGGRYETLSEAIAAADSGDIIYGVPGTYILNTLIVNKALTIKANETGSIVLDGDGSLIFNASADLTLINLTLRNGGTVGYGGLVNMSSASLSAYNSTFEDTLMENGYHRGAAINALGDIYISGCEFRNLSAREAAAVYLAGSGFSLTVEDSIFDNSTGTYDGGLFRLSGSALIRNSNFTNIKGANTSSEYGIIYMNNGNMTVVGCSFINITGPQGAAIYALGGGYILNVTKSLFDNVTCLSKGIIFSSMESYINYNVFINVNEGISFSNNNFNKNIDYNYWGTNEDISTLITSEAPNNWIIMNVELSDLDMIGKTQVELTADFKHYIEDGVIYELEDSLTQEFDVEFISTTGTFDKEIVKTEGQVATATYTAVEDINNITVKSGNAIWSTSFATKPAPDLAYEIEEGGITVSLTIDGAAIEGETVYASLEDGTALVNASTDENGIAVIDLSDLGPGTYSITLSTKSSSQYVRVAEEGIGFVVDPYETVLEVYDATVTVGEGTITATLTSNGVGLEGKTITLRIDGKVEYHVLGALASYTAVTDENGVATFDIGNLPAGLYGATVSFIDGEIYQSDERSIVIEVDKKESSTTVEMEGNNIIVTVEDGGEGIKGIELEITIGEETKTIVTDENGEAVISLDDFELEDGSYQATISFTDDIYEDTSISAFVFIKTETIDEPVGATFIISPSEDGTSLEITVTNIDGVPIADGKVTYFIDGEEAGEITLNGDGEGSIPIDASKNQTIDVVYYEGDCEWSSSYVFVSELEEVEVPVEVPVIANGTISVETADGAVIATLLDSDGKAIGGAAITALVNGEETNLTTDADGKLSIPVDGNATVELSYTDSKGAVVSYTTKVVTETETVEVPVLANGTMSVETADGAVIATLLDSDGKAIGGAVITALVNGEETNLTTDADGKLSIPVDGNVTVELSYTDSKGAVVSYTTKVVTETETVEVPVLANGTMSVETADGAVIATLLDSDGKAIGGAVITALVNGEETNLTTGADGKVSIPVDGNATVELSYVDPSNGATLSYTTKVVTETVEVEVPVEVPAVANATIDVDTSDDGSAFVATVKDLDGKPLANTTITATVNGEEVNYTSDAEGKVTIPVSGETVEISYTDPSNGAKASNTVTVINNTIEVPPLRQASQIEYKNMTTTALAKVDGRIGEYFYATLKDANGKALVNKTVYIGFNGAVYQRVTNESGRVRLQVNLVTAGKYTFAVAFLGDDEYNGSFVAALITVNAQAPKFTTASKTYKASAKTKSLSATFKSNVGTPISGKTVTFTVNGKTYSAKTNAKGVATVKVSLNKKGTYSFTTKYAGDSTFKAATAKAKLTIK